MGALGVQHAGVVDMKPLCDGEVIFYSADADAQALAAHRSENGRAVYLRQDQVILATGMTESFLPGLGKLANWSKHHADRGMTESALLAAVATAWALDIPLNLIGAGIEAFESNHTADGSAD